MDYKIEGMTCTSCALKIEKEIEKIGIKVNINFPKYS